MKEKTMNDPMKPLSEEAIQEIAKALEITRKPKDIMEEKKTKKMAKAEAFEYLKHKKVMVVGEARAIQNKLFKIGYTWCDGTIEAISMVDFLLIDDETFQFTESLSHFRKCGYTEISVDDILSIEIVEDEPLDRWEEFASKVAKIQETLEDDEVCIITKTNYLTMTK